MDEVAQLLNQRRRRASMQYQPRLHSNIQPRHSLFLRQPLSDSIEVWKEPTFRPLIRTLSSTSRSGDLASESLEKSLSERNFTVSKPRTLAQGLTFQSRRMGFGLQTLGEDFRSQESSVSTAQKSEFNQDLLRKIIKIRARTPFEEADLHYDRFLGLEIRKAMLRIWAGFRQMCGFISENHLFQTFIILLILLNTVLLALEDPSLDIQPEPYNSIEQILLYIYTFEMGTKVIYMGLVMGKTAYLRDSWNVLDCTVVLTGWIELQYAGSGINLAALRALRILRPLRSITRIQGMKIVFLSLIGSAQMLLGSIMLLFFFYLIASIALLQMFMGALKYKCMDLETGVMVNSWNDDTICGSVSCPTSQVCAPSLDNPNYGKTHFDNLFMSMLMIFQSVTLEGWFSIMTDLEKTVGRFIVIIYIPFVYLGAFFFMNMTLIAMKSSVRDM